MNFQKWTYLLIILISACLLAPVKCSESEGESQVKDKNEFHHNSG